MIPTVTEAAKLQKSQWVTYWEDELGVAKLEFFKGMAFIHLTLFKPISGMRTVKRELVKLKVHLRGFGYKTLFVIIPDGDDKLYRFEKYVGFQEVNRAGGQILMRQEC